MSPAARRSWLFALFWLAFVGGALLEYLLPPADAGLAGALTHEAAARMLYAAAALALGGLAAVLPRERHCLTPLSIGAIMAAFLVALNNFPIATLLVHRTATVTAPKEAVLAFLLACLGTALFEELLFRGFLLPLCLARTGRTRRGRFAAVLISSAVFGAFHLPNLLAGADPGATLLQVGYSFLVGCVAAVLCLLTGGLLLPVLFHLVYNVGGYLVPRLGTGPLYDTPTVFVTVFLSLACAILVFLALWQEKTPHTGGKNTQKTKKI